jgi:hypothetical protein
MPLSITRAAALAGLMLTGLLLTGAARAADDDKPLGSDGCDHTFARAGFPDETSCVAKPGRRPNYCGYYVGGGCVSGPCISRGGPPNPDQGTWGWDYCHGPCCLNHRVMLGWCYGCRPKGGTGSYRVDGPHIPNPLALKLPETHGDCEVCAHH